MILIYFKSEVTSVNMYMDIKVYVHFSLKRSYNSFFFFVMQTIH